jgi:hypothetical protein
MIEQNRKEFEICNIPLWWEKGYTGKGINIAEIEDADPSLWFFDGKLKDPFNESDRERDWNSHGQKVLDVMHQIAPEATLYVLPSGGSYSNDEIKGDFVEKTIPYAEENNIHIIGASLGGTDNDLLNKRILEAQKRGVVFVTSAGNTAEKGLGAFARSNVWISVGALHYNNSTGKYYRARYSSYDENLDFMTFSNLYIHDAKRKGHYFPMTGTSFSSPMLCGMLALVQQFFLEKTRRTLYQNEVYKFVKDNTKDLGELGFDVEHGYGLFILPDPDDIDMSKYVEVETMNKPEKIILHHSLTDDNEVLSDFEAIRQYHMNVKGWKDIGYHYVIEKVHNKVIVRKGRDEKEIGAHTKGQNDRSIGICLVGNFDEDYVPSTMLEALVNLINDIRDRYGDLPIEGHFKYANKTCPGKKFPWKAVEKMTHKHWAEDIWQELNDLGITIHEKRFDDPITRGEVFALALRIVKFIMTKANLWFR